MSAAVSSRDARARLPRAMRAGLRLVLPVAAVVGFAALMQAVYDPSHIGYDARYALLWARDLWQGYTPEYTAAFAPTPHPLTTALSSLALPLGDAAGKAVTWGILLALGTLGWLIYRLGAQLFSPWVGAVAALVVLTRPALQRDASLAFQDVPFAALVVGAVLLEARRPRRGAAVLAVLALAGLMRPEAWALAGLYVLYLWPAVSWRDRARYAALAALAPAIWALTDLVVTGDLLHSLNGTAALAEENERRRTIAEAPFWTLQYYGFALREPLVVGVPIGLLFAWLYRRRPAALPLAVVIAMTAVFVVGPLFGLPLMGRYVRTPAALLTLFYGLAVVGWHLLPPGAARRRWMALGALSLVLSLAFLPRHVDMLQSLDRRLERGARPYIDLEALAAAPAVRAAFAECAPLSAAHHDLVPHVRFWLDGAPGSVGTTEDGADPLGRVLVAPRDTPQMRRRYRDEARPREAPAGYRTIYANRSWRVYAAPGCATR